MPKLVFVVGADLRGRGDQCRVGPELARVCQRAIQVHQGINRDKDAFLLATAGWSEKYRACMQLLIEKYLTRHGVSIAELYSPRHATTFNTQGEAVALANFLKKKKDQWILQEVHLVCRWWHLPRALVIFRKECHATGVAVKFIGVPVWRSYEWWALVTSEPLAWLKYIAFSLLRKSRPR